MGLRREINPVDRWAWHVGVRFALIYKEGRLIALTSGKINRGTRYVMALL